MAVCEAITTSYLESSQNSITFSSIPSTYEHLQIRANLRDSGTGNYSAVKMWFATGGGSEDYGSNYTFHQIYSHGPTIKSEMSGSVNHARAYGVAANDVDPHVQPSVFASCNILIVDYANTSKNTTWEHNGYSWVNHDYTNMETFASFGGGMWNNTGAVDKIVFGCEAAPYLRGSTITLYGIKAAN
jgi:hypothetical protein